MWCVRLPITRRERVEHMMSCLREEGQTVVFVRGRTALHKLDIIERAILKKIHMSTEAR